ncbi:cytochrome P450 [Sorangium sp. So ce233]|uniref:cytochrome P450 n=1 Tax=Sorangium sp. So ce233 TaxID=3133290 RepID=UPI003F5EC5A8
MNQVLTDTSSGQPKKLVDVLTGHKALHRELEKLKDDVSQILSNTLTSPEVLRPTFALLRSVKPIFVISKTALVTRYDDVLEVLQNGEGFSVVPIYAAKMEATSGAFILGMDDTPQYRRESTILQKAVRRGDLAIIRGLVTRFADEAIGQALPKGEIDAVASLSHPVPARVVATFFGVPGPDEATLMRWLRTIFHEIFLNLTNDPEVTAQAAVSSREMRVYLEGLIAERKAEIAAGKTERDDFLTRLIKMQGDPETHLDDDGVRRNIGGVILGAVDTISAAIAQALDQLLDRPDQLNDAHEAALADNDALVKAHAFEALRFNPQTPLVIRRSTRQVTLAMGTPRETTIPAGVDVYAATLSAMFDPDKLSNPSEYRVDRQADDYLHFSFGIHTCFGQHISGVEVPEVLKSLLRQKHLRRALGPEGKLRYGGPFPKSLVVKFKPA